MTAPFYYPYSTTYLAQHMARISRNIVFAGLFGISAFGVAAGVYSLAAIIANAFN